VRATREGEPGLAPGYQRAMHGLCLGCHREQERKLAAADLYLSRCATCHRDGLTIDGAGLAPSRPVVVADTGRGPSSEARPATVDTGKGSP
jgi:hypothetical protein